MWDNVKYLVIGGIAAVLHGVPRATFDLDILIEATSENAIRLLTARVQLGVIKPKVDTFAAQLLECFAP